MVLFVCFVKHQTLRILETTLDFQFAFSPEISYEMPMCTRLVSYEADGKIPRLYFRALWQIGGSWCDVTSDSQGDLDVVTDTTVSYHSSISSLSVGCHWKHSHSVTPQFWLCILIATLCQYQRSWGHMTSWIVLSMILYFGTSGDKSVLYKHLHC